MPNSVPNLKPRAGAARRSWRRFAIAAAVALPLLQLSAAPALGHSDSPASPPLLPQTLLLRSRTVADLIALLAREHLPGPEWKAPRAARNDEAESLLPPGVDAVLRGVALGEVILVGTEGVGEVRECLAVLDAPLVSTGPDRSRVTLTLRHGDALLLRRQTLALPGAGAAAVAGRQLTLEGTRAWLHRAQRLVLLAELRPQASP